MTDRCKHGMVIGTCGMCAGLVKTVGELHYLWIDFCDTLYALSHNATDKYQWFKNNRVALIQQFYEKNKQKPPFPTYPEK